jgi:hypothetical protein
VFAPAVLETEVSEDVVVTEESILPLMRTETTITRLPTEVTEESFLVVKPESEETRDFSMELTVNTFVSQQMVIDQTTVSTTESEINIVRDTVEQPKKLTESENLEQTLVSESLNIEEAPSPESVTTTVIPELVHLSSEHTELVSEAPEEVSSLIEEIPVVSETHLQTEKPTEEIQPGTQLEQAPVEEVPSAFVDTASMSVTEEFLTKAVAAPLEESVISDIILTRMPGSFK